MLEHLNSRMPQVKGKILHGIQTNVATSLYFLRENLDKIYVVLNYMLHRLRKRLRLLDG